MDITTGSTEVSLVSAGRVIDDKEAVAVDEGVLDYLDRGAAYFGELARTQRVYGLNSGFGPMASHAIAPEDWGQLQVNLVRSHAMGLGPPLPGRLVRAVMLARLCSLVQGKSATGRSPAVLLAGMLNAGILPAIPEHGGVGASGDLVQLAHLALCMLGEGEAAHGGAPIPAGEALRAAGLSPLCPRLREGLALVNGTAAMTGIGVTAVLDARRLVSWGIAAGCLLQEVVGNSLEPFSEELNEAKRHGGQRDVARVFTRVLSESGAVSSNGKPRTRAGRERPLQEHYSVRCLPQVLGPVLDTVRQAGAVVGAELNSVSDNPVFDLERGKVYHGGNFHGDYVALEMDKLKLGLVKLVMLLERQLDFLMDDRLNGLLPPFVNLGRLGLELGMQGAQFTATSTAAECQTLAAPMSIHSIPCNKGNQDVVSMGCNAALMTRRVVENGYQVLAILMLALAQAVDALELGETLSPLGKATFDGLRRVVPCFRRDSLKNGELEAVRSWLSVGRPDFPEALCWGDGADAGPVRSTVVSREGAAER